jgi:hypothetical protein
MPRPLHDGDGHGRIDAEDLLANILIASLLAPDLDLFDASGAFRPR